MRLSAARISEDRFTSLYYGYMDAIVREDWSEASILCDSLLASVPPDSHAYAKAANHKALLEGKAGRSDEELAWFIRSAMADIQSAVRDHGSLCAVSEELFNRGDVERAMDYIRVAIRDTRFSTLRAVRGATWPSCRRSRRLTASATPACTRCTSC